MNRHDRRKAIAEGRKTCPDLDLRRGMIGTALAGTTHWGPNGKNLGVWGRDKPVKLVQFLDEGGVRELTPAEERLARRVYGLTI